jgi:hypothetical protein
MAKELPAGPGRGVMLWTSKTYALLRSILRGMRLVAGEGIRIDEMENGTIVSLRGETAGEGAIRHPFRLQFGIGAAGTAEEGVKGVYIQIGVVRDMLANQIIPDVNETPMVVGVPMNFLPIGEFVGNVYLKVTVDESDWDVEATAAEMVFYESTDTQPVDDSTEKFAFIGFYNSAGIVSNSVQWSLQINRCGPLGTAITWLPY